jgi:hypothetical protein
VEHFLDGGDCQPLFRDEEQLGFEIWDLGAYLHQDQRAPPAFISEIHGALQVDTIYNLLAERKTTDCAKLNIAKDQTRLRITRSDSGASKAVWVLGLASRDNSIIESRDYALLSSSPTVCRIQLRNGGPNVMAGGGLTAGVAPSGVRCAPTNAINWVTVKGSHGFVTAPIAPA